MEYDQRGAYKQPPGTEHLHLPPPQDTHLIPVGINPSLWLENKIEAVLSESTRKNARGLPRKEMRGMKALSVSLLSTC